jgi:WD40 repeat protein
MKILTYLLGLGLMADAVFGEGQSAPQVPAIHASEQIQKPDFAITNASAAAAGIIAYNPTGRYLAVAGDRTIQIYDTNARDGLTPNQTRTLTDHTAQILGLAFSGTNTLVSVSADQTAKIWDVETGKLLHTAQIQLAKQLCFAIAPGRLLAADTSFGRVRLWNFETGEILKSFEPGDSWASVLAFTPDEKSLVIGTEKGVLRVMDVATWAVTRTIDLDSPIRSLAVSAEHIVVGYSDGTVAMLNFGDQPSVPEVKKQSGAINALAFIPKSDFFASASADHTIKIFETSSLKLLSSLQSQGAPLLALSLSLNGKTIVSLNSSGVLEFWTLPKEHDLK